MTDLDKQADVIERLRLTTPLDRGTASVVVADLYALGISIDTLVGADVEQILDWWRFRTVLDVAALLKR